MATEFVKGWLLLDTLGDGRFGEVKLLMNKDTREMVAVKVLIIRDQEMDKQVKKEICIHKNLQHENIISFYGNRRDDDSKIEYLFLEYAQHGELFEQIEPDVGMEISKAFRFFIDLLNGIEYLHKRGIVHRDIKPENLLLDQNYKLKISDFGFATLFRHNGKERLLTQMCGSIPYIAPEVLCNQPHRAEPLDLWSCGIVLVAMLTGELPWSEAIISNKHFEEWSKGRFNLHKGPWCKIDTITLSLIKLILQPDPSKRIHLDRIRTHRSFVNNTNKLNRLQNNQKPTKKHKNNGSQVGFLSQPHLAISNSCSQNNIKLHDGDDMHKDELDVSCQNDEDWNNWKSFSQPNRIQDMFLSTQTQMEISSQGSFGSESMTPPATKLYLRLVRRMTRFLTDMNFKETVKTLENAFDDLNWSWKRLAQSPQGHYKITMTDRNRIPLVFRSSINEMSSDKILVDFRLSKGNGIEFKRQFMTIKKLLKPIIIQKESQENLFDSLS